MANARLDNVLRHLRTLASPSYGTTDGDLLHRFLTGQDQQAFATLVHRHGALVLGVCRRVLRQQQDAEDAFQATFLILARKAGSIRKPGSLTSWLHGVAYRMAMDAKRRASRRRTHEARAEAAPPQDPSREAAWREVQAVLDAEIQRLPDRLRMPFLLCCLEGHGRAEAARQLGLKEGTVWSRLTQARKQLQQRLARQGITLSAVLATAALSGGASEAAVPTGLAASTARAAVAAGGASSAGGVSAQVIGMVERGLRSMAMARLKLGLVLALTVGLLAGGAAILTRQLPAATPPPQQAAGPERAPKGAEPREAKAPVDRLGDPLPPGALVRMGTVRMRHREAVSSVVFLSDGQHLATAGGDGWIRIWQPTDGKETLRLGDGKGQPAAIALSPDGKVLAEANGEVLRLWDARTGKELRRIPCETVQHHPLPLVFAPDGAALATVAKDHSIRLYQAATGKETLTLPPLSEGVRCLAFAPDGKSLLAATGQGQGGAIRVWELPGGRLVREVALRSSKGLRVRPLIFAPDGRTLAVECATWEQVKKGTGTSFFTQYRLALWDVATGRERLRTEGERDVLWAAAFAPDGKSVATHGMGNRIMIWDTTTGKLRGHLEGYPDGARSDGLTTLAFSPDGNLLAAVGEGAAVHVWNVTTGAELGSAAEAHHAHVSALAYAPDGRTLASAGADHTIRLWDAATGRPLNLFRGHDSTVRSLVYSPDGKMLASAAANRDLRLWDTATGKERHAIQAVPRTEGTYFGICPLAFTPDGKRLVSWGDDRRLRLWDVATGKEMWNRLIGVVKPSAAAFSIDAGDLGSMKDRIQDVAFSPHGRTVAVAVNGAIHLVEAATGQELVKFSAPESAVEHMAFSPDGRTLAAGGWDKTVRLWEAATGQELVRVEGLDFVNAVAFAPDGRTVAAASGWANGTIHFLDARTGQVLSQFRGHGCYVGTLAFAPDGKTLASGQRDTTVLVWDLTPGLQQLGRLPRKDVEALWTDLAGADARKARTAVWSLVEAPEAALPLLKSRLRPIERTKPEDIQRLIADLGSATFTVRREAQQKLGILGVEAEPALRNALQAGNLPLETKRRVQALLDGPAPRSVPTGEGLRRLRAIHVLEQIGSRDAGLFLQTLAEGAPGARETQDAKAACERLALRAGRP
jgi:RNA polymerase sigma factor (sigma-70 family)